MGSVYVTNPTLTKQATTRARQLGQTGCRQEVGTMQIFDTMFDMDI